MNVSSVYSGFGVSGNDILAFQKSNSDLEKTSKFEKALQNAATKNTFNKTDFTHSLKYDTRLPGDYISSFETKISDHDYESKKTSRPQGFAANQGFASAKDAEHAKKMTIDRTDKLYEKALELESFLVKIMLNSMKNTVNTSGLFGGDSFATKMYQDMFYDELAGTVTKNAGLGLADQVYLQLNQPTTEIPLEA